MPLQCICLSHLGLDSLIGLFITLVRHVHTSWCELVYLDMAVQLPHDYHRQRLLFRRQTFLVVVDGLSHVDPLRKTKKSAIGCLTYRLAAFVSDPTSLADPS